MFFRAWRLAHSVAIFEISPAQNGTCALLAGYVGTASCSGGVLGYARSSHGGGKEDHGGVGDGVLAVQKPAAPAPTAALIRTLAQASPSLMWAFPRAGSAANTSWTRSDILVKTPSKSYTAFDIVELFTDTDQAKHIDLLDYLSTEPDMATLAAPAVDTFVSYGMGIPTLSSIEFASDLKKGRPAPSTIKNSTDEDGDGLVPVRSSVRAQDMWADAQTGLSKRLVYQPCKDLDACPGRSNPPSLHHSGVACRLTRSRDCIALSPAQIPSRRTPRAF